MGILNLPLAALGNTFRDFKKLAEGCQGVLFVFVVKLVFVHRLTQNLWSRSLSRFTCLEGRITERVVSLSPCCFTSHLATIAETGLD